VRKSASPAHSRVAGNLEAILNLLRLAPITLAFAVLAAHFYRAADWLPFAGTLAVASLVFVRRPWAARVLQAGLLAGAVEWARTAVALVAVRESMGQPWTRLAIILGAVALFTAVCALALESRALRSRFGRTGEANE